jgi:hypothetical protein
MGLTIFNAQKGVKRRGKRESAGKENGTSVFLVRSEVVFDR